MISEHTPATDAVTNEAARRLVRLQSDAVTDAERRDTAAWLAASPAHRAAFDGLRGVWGDLDAMPDPRPTRAAAALPERRRPPRRADRRMVSFGLLAASALLAVFAASGELDRLRSDHSTRAGERRTVTLADGSVVHLNTDTAIAVDFSGPERRVTLRRGEAFFTVTPNRERPFEVTATGAVTRVLGTRFAVRVMDGTTRVAVEEGRVAVGCPAGVVPDAASAEDSDNGLGNDGGRGGGVRLTAGDVARYDARNCPRIEDGVNVARATAWRTGTLIVDGQPLSEVVGELNRYRPGPILLLDRDLAGRRVTGVFDIRDPDRALAAIEQVLPVRVRRVTGYLALVTARAG